MDTLDAQTGNAPTNELIASPMIAVRSSTLVRCRWCNRHSARLPAGVEPNVAQHG